MDVLYFMKSEHEAVLSALERFVSADSVAQKREAFNGLKNILSVHLKLEETYLYPELAGLFPGSDVVVDVAIAEHVVVGKHLDSIGKTLSKPVSEHTGLDKKIETFVEMVRKHVGTQEQSLMPKLRQLIPTVAREELGEVLLDAKEEMMAAPEAVSLLPESQSAKASGMQKSRRA
jgi:hypothetical protein